MEAAELGLTALRAAAVYVLVLAVLRLSGKRTIGNFSAIDLLVALMLGEVVDEVVYGDVSFVQGVVAIGAIAAVEQANTWLTYRSERFATLVEGTPTVVVRHGAFQADGMRVERLNETDVMSLLRQHGVQDLRTVARATVETDGQVSILLEPWAEPLRKGDLDGAAGLEEPPEWARTDAPRVLGSSS